MCLVYFKTTFKASFIERTESALVFNFSFSASFNLTSTISDTPLFPIIQGTPIQMSFRLYSPSK